MQLTLRIILQNASVTNLLLKNLNKFVLALVPRQAAEVKALCFNITEIRSPHEKCYGKLRLISLLTNCNKRTVMYHSKNSEKKCTILFSFTSLPQTFDSDGTKVITSFDAASTTFVRIRHISSSIYTSRFQRKA